MVFNTKELCDSIIMCPLRMCVMCALGRVSHKPLGSLSLWCPIIEQVSVVGKMGQGGLSKLKSALLERSRLLRLGE